METPWKFHREGRGERKGSNTKPQEHRMMVTVQQGLALFRIYLNSTRFLQHHQAGLSVYLWQEEQWLALGPKPRSVRNPVFQSQSVLDISVPNSFKKKFQHHRWKLDFTGDILESTQCNSLHTYLQVKLLSFMQLPEFSTLHQLS